MRGQTKITTYKNNIGNRIFIRLIVLSVKAGIRSQIHGITGHRFSQQLGRVKV